MASTLLVLGALCGARAFDWRSRSRLLGGAAARLAGSSDEDVLAHITSSNVAQIATLLPNPEPASAHRAKTNVPPNGYRPVVQMHGMGDFAENPAGMVPLKKAISKELDGTYVTNVALAKNPIADSMATFLMLMQEEVDTFAKAVREDRNLSQGFNAIGYSQGNLIIRGYIEQYNDPPVFNWISLHGILMGVAGFPHCNFSSEICKLFDEFLGDAAYFNVSQHAIAQANYFRDPLRIPEYTKNCLFTPPINNERTANSTFTKNFAKLEKVGLVKALEDTMVWPNDSEWFGFYKDNSTSALWKMEDAPWYDNFGLKSLNQAGRVTLHTTPGDHLRIPEADLLKLVDTYFKN